MWNWSLELAKWGEVWAEASSCFGPEAVRGAGRILTVALASLPQAAV